MEFVVLAKSDGSDRALVSAEQSSSAIEHGFTVVEFRVEASTRGGARRRWDDHRTGRQPSVVGPVDAVEEADAWGLESLTDAERAAVVDLVVALAEHDRPVLEEAGAYATYDGDPYAWTLQYGRWGRVDLIVPPGDPRHWAGGVDRWRPSWIRVIVDMWTAQEGPSDLSLETDVLTDADGRVRARFDHLHVM